MSKEGSLGAPIRHPIDFEHPDFLNPEKLDAEMRRVFAFKQSGKFDQRSSNNHFRRKCY